MKKRTNRRHTPGPWIAMESAFGSWDIQTDKGASAKSIAAVSWPVYLHSGTVTGRYPAMALNASLIAAAPDLLSELRKALTLIKLLDARAHAKRTPLRISQIEMTIRRACGSGIEIGKKRGIT